MIYKLEIDASGNINHVYSINGDVDYVDPKRGIVITADLFEALMGDFDLLRTIYKYGSGKLQLRSEQDVKALLSKGRRVEGLTEDNVTDVLSQYKAEESENIIKDIYLEEGTAYGSKEDTITTKTDILKKEGEK